jgi:acyl-coenzyme A thioesterase PaaI-like protein
MKELKIEVPKGFEPHFRKSKFTDPWEPLYSKVESDQVRLGTQLTDAHCNSRGLVHGAFLAAIADNALGLSCAQVLQANGFEFGGLVTSNLSIDYVGMAKVGDWIGTDIEVIKTGKTLCIANCIIRSNKGPIARANATFQITW